MWTTHYMPFGQKLKSHQREVNKSITQVPRINTERFKSSYFKSNVQI